jgi:hypothetical protein
MRVVPEVFARDHLVDLEPPVERLADGRVLLVQHAADGGLHHTAPLGSLSGEDFVPAAEAVVQGLLTGWNGPGPEVDRLQPLGGEVPLSGFLQGELDEPGAWGSAGRWGANIGVFRPDQPALAEPWVYSDGLRLPNPYLLVRGGSSLTDPCLRMLEGCVHRDLHLDNVLVPNYEGRPRPEAYRFIDLATFDEHGAQSRDVATLLLSSLVPFVRGGLPPDQRRALLRYVVDPLDRYRTDITPAGAARVRAIRDTAQDLMGARRWRDGWERLLLASLVAESLRFTTYTALGDEGRLFYARLAAHAGDMLLRQLRVHRREPDLGTADRDSFRLPGFTAPARLSLPTDAFGPGRTPQRRWEVSTVVTDKSAVVGFGPEGAVVVIDGHGGIHRWSAEGDPLGAMSAGDGGALRLGHQALVGTVTPSVAIARPRRLDLVHLATDGAVHRLPPVSLGGEEFLVTSGGDVLATHDRHRILLRRFDDGAPIESLPCPGGLAASAISADGTVVALAAPRSVTIHRRGQVRVVQLTRNSLPHARMKLLRAVLPDPGCWLAVSPSGSHVACVTFEELVVWRLADDAEVKRRDLSDREALDGLGAAQMRLVCTDAGALLWLRRGRLSTPTAEPTGVHLEQAGYANDIAVSRDGRRMARMRDDGVLEVSEWEA